MYIWRKLNISQLFVQEPRLLWERVLQELLLKWKYLCSNDLVSIFNQRASRKGCADLKSVWISDNITINNVQSTFYSCVCVCVVMTLDLGFSVNVLTNEVIGCFYLLLVWMQLQLFYFPERIFRYSVFWNISKSLTDQKVFSTITFITNRHSEKGSNSTVACQWNHTIKGAVVYL